jgi:hypothetical protein
MRYRLSSRRVESGAVVHALQRGEGEPARPRQGGRVFRGKSCLLCGRGIHPAIRGVPDYWIRLEEETWVAGARPPVAGEVPTALYYRCGPCGKTFQLVIGPPCIDEGLRPAG